MEFAPPDWRPIRVAIVGDGIVDAIAGSAGADERGDGVADRRGDTDANEREDAGANERDAADLSIEEFGPDELLQRLAATCVDVDPAPDRIDCVVTGSDPGDWATAAFVGAIRERDPDVPVLVRPATGSVDEAADATAAGAARYLPQSTDQPAALPSAVREVADRHDAARTDVLCRQLFHAMLDDLQLAIFFKDLDGRHVCGSERVASSLTESVLGKTDVDLYLDDIGEQARESYEDDLAVARRGERIVQKEERHVTERGEVDWLRTTKVPWYGLEGERRGLLGITETIGEAKAREAELERERKRLEAFASFASHDLRNPVSIASGYLELARESGDPESLEKVEGALERMDGLIDDVLALVQPGTPDESMSWIDLHDAVADACERTGTASASITVVVPEGVELLAAEGLLGQLLDNLLENSTDHAGSGVEIEVGLSGSGFYVADDGPGIDADEPDRVFEYGYTEGGTGLGLAIVKEVASYHRWEPSVGAAPHEVPDGAIGQDAPPASRGYDGACFSFEHCILRAPPHRNAVEGTPVEPDASTDVGAPALQGSSARLADGSATDAAGDPVGPDAWQVSGGGKNLWRDVEEYHLRYADVPGDVRIVARLADLEYASEYTKAGLLVGSWPTAGQPLSFLGSIGVHGCESIYRPASDDVLYLRNHPDRTEVPIWLRLDRVGQRVTCYVSADGEDWTPVDQHVLGLEGSVVAGLAICSHNTGRRSTAIFDHVRIAPLDSPVE